MKQTERGGTYMDAMTGDMTYVNRWSNSPFTELFRGTHHRDGDDLGMISINYPEV